MRPESSTRQARADPRRVTVLGVPVDADPPEEILERLLKRAAVGIPTKVYYANAHTLNCAVEDAVLRRCLQDADVVLADGYGVCLAARWLGQQEPRRMAITDCIWSFAAGCARDGLPLYILAGRPGVADRAAQVLGGRYPGLEIAGTHHGYVSSPEATASALSDIRAKGPGALCVGMGTPAQELWVERNFPTLGVPLVFAVGAVMDYVSGEVERPRPQWMSEHGLEWVTRLTAEPRRMWRRYLLGNPKFLARVARSRLGCEFDRLVDDLLARGWSRRP
jgi:N-acetylglucosaminyldiphosphoundecaprenol N-acetyl-beta-D-mannosaminyltransferase